MSEFELQHLSQEKVKHTHARADTHKYTNTYMLSSMRRKNSSFTSYRALAHTHIQACVWAQTHARTQRLGYSQLGPPPSEKHQWACKIRSPAGL